MIEPGLQVSLDAPNVLSRLKATPGTLREGGASFATTHWSEVAPCALTDVPEATDALARLCETYWPPIYSFIPNGKVLVAGGFNGSSVLTSAELYDPVTGSWSATGTLNSECDAHTATLLSNGTVLVAGGQDSTLNPSASS